AWVAENAPWVHRLLPNCIEDAALRAKIRADVQKAITAADEVDRTLRTIGQDRETLRAKRRVPHLKEPRGWKQAFRPAPGLPRFVTNGEFIRDIHKLASMLPPETT